ncbi:Glycosyl hydrolases family 2, TIM barrel domain [Mucilaginibacter gossypiicola]|uniref:Glycosyl hydrolases family 2, TIM barrel domain n=1 Tax=Mucilaginibacter gossypiicola TaxID=551995 RepID=A0A1H8K994_9SPHI|nr:glycoside hydrolase family 2 TIM barrel-domain containing protein [Mucilaginibacter gossypiicola]SEN89579.1 Glycosyl hydrolases family 2, TIM barrel domain [Mucilaginibacter gossypiicola]
MTTTRSAGRSALFKFSLVLSVLASGVYQNAEAQTSYELNSGWKCTSLNSVKDNGTIISQTNYDLAAWNAAVVPGTVLTTQVANKQVPDPFYGMNNEKIPDIYKVGRDFYTYWFAKDFKEAAPTGSNQTYLNFRGVNYSCDVFLNGHKLNSKLHKGMFLRQSYNITKWLNKNGNNRLAVVVYPPDVVGNPNGGQGGDGTIARGVGIQYTAGWDWIQPIRDRNTGIWDKVTIEHTGAVAIKDPHVVTLVPGVRKPEGAQQPAIIQVSAEVENATGAAVSGTLQYNLDGKLVSQPVTLKANSKQEVKLTDYSLKNPKLWWPSGYGPQNLYKLNLQFVAGGKVSDQKSIEVGVRQITTEWNNKTESRQVNVNGQKVFIKGGNWIISDQMLRFSDARYDAEVRFHRDMNLNLIRVWGGALIERPEFYEACDKYGMLVFQDMWGSGDCNGRWIDPMKADDQWTRRKYPDDHDLYLKSVADQVKLVRNFPSLAIWCGGNEITPPEDIFAALRDTIMPKLDNTRWFIPYSNSEEMSRNVQGGNGDGPYGIQSLTTFWDHQTYPFNSEVGSVGVSDYESLKRFIPAENMVVPEFDASTGKTKTDPVWEYHKYIGYDGFIDKYGKAKNVEDFATKAQLVNYDQYRALMEGFSSHMWDWYTGTIIWKTQNPWTAMRGQMYDYYLDPNACLYGLHNGSEPLHIMYNQTDGMVMVANNTFKTHSNMLLVAKTYDMDGKEKVLTKVFADVTPTTTKRYLSLKREIEKEAKDKGIFLCLQLLKSDNEVISENIYWLPDANGDFSGLQKMPKGDLGATAKYLKNGKVEVTLTNEGNGALAFFNRLSLVNADTKQRILPAFYSDNYVTVLPGQTKKVVIDHNPGADKNLAVTIGGWNVTERTISIDK